MKYGAEKTSACWCIQYAKVVQYYLELAILEEVREEYVF